MGNVKYMNTDKALNSIFEKEHNKNGALHQITNKMYNLKDDIAVDMIIESVFEYAKIAISNNVVSTEEIVDRMARYFVQRKGFESVEDAKKYINNYLGVLADNIEQNHKSR